MKKLLFLAATLFLFSCSGNSSDATESIEEFKSKTQRTDKSLFRIGVESLSYVPGGIVANNGPKTSPDSIMDKHKLRVFYTQNNIENLLDSFEECSLDIIVLPLSTYADNFHTLKKYSPVLFLLSGWSNGNEALIVPETMTTVSELGNGIIACIKDSPEFYTLSTVVGNSTSKTTTNFVNARDTDEILEMLKSGKARAAIVDLNKIKNVPKGYKTLLSSSYFSKSSPYVYITRGLFLAQRKEFIAPLINGIMEGNYALLSQKGVPSDPNTAKHISSPSGGILTSAATYSDNKIFFRMNSRSGYDFFSLIRYYKYYSLKKELQREIAFESTANFKPFESANLEKYQRSDNAYWAGYFNGTKIIFSLRVDFTGSSMTIDAQSDTQLQTVVMTAEQSPRSILLFSYQPSSYEGMNTAFVYQRLAAVKNHLQTKNISAYRMRDNSEDMYNLRKADPATFPESASVLIQFAE